jgi:peptide/nickel transport system permease protein
MKHKKLILWGVFIVFVLLLFLIPHQSIKATDILNTYQGLSAEHWLGTDNLGRDTFALMVTGGQRTLLCVFLATVISFTFGSLLGMIAAYEGGLVRSLVQFTADFVTVIPSLIMALIFSALFGFSAVSAGIIFGIGNMGQYINLSEGLTAGMKDRDFIGAEVSLGLRKPAILFRHVFPNIMRQLFVYLGNNASSVVLQYAGLAFIGLGTDVTNPDWGTLLYQYRAYILSYPRLVLLPILAVCLLALFFHYAFDSAKLEKTELTIYD